MPTASAILKAWGRQRLKLRHSAPLSSQRSAAHRDLWRFPSAPLPASPDCSGSETESRDFVAVFLAFHSSTGGQSHLCKKAQGWAPGSPRTLNSGCSQTPPPIHFGTAQCVRDTNRPPKMRVDGPDLAFARSARVGHPTHKVVGPQGFAGTWPPDGLFSPAQHWPVLAATAILRQLPLRKPFLR